MNFKLFLENSELYDSDIKKTLNKLPKKHRILIKDYKIKFEPKNTLKNDSNHIGFINEKNKIIRIAAPWNYGRGFTLLHEVAHAVWKYIVTDEQKKEWNKIYKQEKKKIKHESINQSAEEIFAMVYANFYSKHKLMTYKNKIWNSFIEKLDNGEK